MDGAGEGIETNFGGGFPVAVKFNLMDMSSIMLIQEFKRICPEVEDVLARVRGDVPFLKREIWQYQAMALYILAKQYNHESANILEIGTAWGYSAAVMSRAAPEADIVTLNPKWAEVERAQIHLRNYKNVQIVQQYSWNYLDEYMGPELDMVFVDGDHKQVIRDLPWFNWLKVGGLMLFHDYSPPGAGKRPCRPVYEEVNRMKEQLGRKEFDVLVVDKIEVGMAGFYRREGETWHMPQ